MSTAATHKPAARRRDPTADERIAAADLPEPVAQRIAAIVRATRLWKSERADIARELIAHAQDAITAGRTPEDAAESLGAPATIAPLLRRSAKRKRHWLWQARHRTLQAIGISLLAMIGVYIVLFIRFNTGSPDIKHNYIAELNERNSAYTDDQKALPAFEALHRAWLPVQSPLLTFDTRDEEGNELPRHAMERYPFSDPNDRGYDGLVAAHAEVLPQLDAAIAASRRPVFGMLYSDRYERIVDENGFQYFEMLPPAEDPHLSGPVIEVLLPALGQARQISQLFAFDAAHAAHHNNPDRAAESLTAIFDTARLTGREHTLIASLVAVAIQTMGETILLQILHDHPDLFNEAHLTAIAHTASVSGRTARDLDFETERRMFGDFLQRAYTNDGRGDGRLTAEGVRLALYLDAITPENLNELTNTTALRMRLTGPVAMLAYGSRRDQREIHDRLMRLADDLLATPPASDEHRRLRRQADELTDELGSSPRYRMAAILTPAFLRSIESAHKGKAQTDATLTTIALHTHRQGTGRWPDILDELVPHLLPAVPEDPFDPGRPIKYRLIEGVPHLYFVGANAQDNHATRPARHGTHFPNPKSLSRRYAQGDNSPSTRPEDQGDWIIYPPEPSR
ncbi:MAG: DUF1700 domain-containing protein [Phycisphaerales bacterium]|nr:hypothetical protein [Planctomycetota bacterium]MCH8507367.1 DUF1700 domain-containing protein [Phycisphaerales bacterium]